MFCYFNEKIKQVYNSSDSDATGEIHYGRENHSGRLAEIGASQVRGGNQEHRGQGGERNGHGEGTEGAAQYMGHSRVRQRCARAH